MTEFTMKTILTAPRRIGVLFHRSDFEQIFGKPISAFKFETNPYGDVGIIVIPPIEGEDHNTYVTYFMEEGQQDNMMLHRSI